MFLNTLIENTKALEKMEFPVDSWCYLLFYINFQKLDGNLKKHFEDKHADKELPTFADLIKFLETEIRILESSAEPQASTSAGRRIGGGQSQAVKAHAAFQGAGSASASSCRLCGKGGHFIAKCEKFLEMKPAARKRQVVSLRLCFKCLNGHNIDKCTYNKNCYKCNSAKHHYLLHFDLPATGSDREQRLTSNVATNGKSHNSVSSFPSVPVVSAPLTSGNPEGAVPGVSGLMASQAKKPKVLLATAIIRVLDSSGRYQEARALLDGGSESTFISESCVQRLGLERFKPDDPITGLGCTPITGCRGAVNLTMTPRLTDQPVLVTTANVLNKISYNLPGYSLPAQLADNYRGLDLADEQFFVSREIDILLGEDLLCDIVLSGRIKIHDNIPRVTKTVFGHVLSGPVNIGVSLRVPCASQAFFCSTSTDRILERFWEVEDIPFKAENPKDLECETIFRDTHSRTEEGRYSARLPFISDAPELGNTVPIAMKRFLAMERRLLAKGNEVFREKYTEFMREYAETGHMSLCEGEPNDYASGSYIIPHHGIFKKDCDKIRVVFDASCASTNGVALNDCLHAGPKLQRDIAEIICRFRLHRYVFTTDIRMMFRQILIAEEDRRFQLIFWRESPDLPLRVYRLNTVTYGMKSSPYLAIRTLRQLADDEEMQFPAAAQLLRSSVYMDDILGGADSIEDASKLKQELTDLLRSGGFELSKWTSSSKEVLQDIAEEHLEKPRKIFDNADGPSFYKILGVQWDSSSDCFSYRTKLDDTSGCTKRSILSTLARAFDPLGWICPVIFQGKVLMQQLWLKNMSWDAKAPDDVVAEWQGILKDMPLISNLRLERFVLLDVKSCSLHGFSDASELGYGAAVYLRTVGHDGRVKVSIMMAKSRVSPVKSKLTIPKLELSGAALLVRLLKYVVAAISDDLTIDGIFGWCDSTIVLSWLKTSPHLLQTFEGNRVSQILNCGLNIAWRHLPSEMNPADVASRGCRASVLLEHPLWWGPPWLSGDAETWPRNIMDKAEDPLPGLRKVKVNVQALVGIVDKDNIFTRFSCLNMLLTVVAYCFRFVNNARPLSEKLRGVLSVPERRFALQRLIKLVQQEEFADDIHCLDQNKQCSKRLRRLLPFIADDGLLRVGGRLEHSSANRYLDDVRKYLASEEAQQGLSDGAAKQSITWRFNSPAAPHFGGLFEATVKSAKTLLRRVIEVKLKRKQQVDVHHPRPYLEYLRQAKSTPRRPTPDGSSDDSGPPPPPPPPARRLDEVVFTTSFVRGWGEIITVVQTVSGYGDSLL
ncbi:uncharacterized protein LOC125235800 [Leguminivora glycinivorella]|uniref:uncharacterized protein LOC125235800 n=1 Tax=Leguminivora glycinivorella TaxID=1035111 RepID=UPI00200DE29C|nr:uncharacterized protein LOC125235800 [Leguminivora glycinivorella]